VLLFVINVPGTVPLGSYLRTGTCTGRKVSTRYCTVATVANTTVVQEECGFLASGDWNHLSISVSTVPVE
jgi:hypothetical protein